MPSVWDIVKRDLNPDTATAVSDIALLTPLTGVKINELYSSDEDKKALADALNAVRAATGENQKVALIAQRGAVFLGLLRRLGVGI
jgi:hypothetical protein